MWKGRKTQRSEIWPLCDSRALKLLPSVRPLIKATRFAFCRSNLLSACLSIVCLTVSSADWSIDFLSGFGFRNYFLRGWGPLYLSDTKVKDRLDTSSRKRERSWFPAPFYPTRKRRGSLLVCLTNVLAVFLSSCDFLPVAQLTPRSLDNLSGTFWKMGRGGVRSFNL